MMKRALLKPILVFALLAMEMTVLVTVAWGAVNSGSVRSPFPTGWRIPFYNDGRARITAGPGEGGHTGASAKAIDFVAMDTWASTKDVRATSPGTVKLATTYDCPGKTVAIEDSNKNASFYYHLASWSVSPGQSVARGQVIADWDNTGTCTTGPHLHFEGRNSVNWSLPLSSGKSVV